MTKDPEKLVLIERLKEFIHDDPFDIFADFIIALSNDKEKLYMLAEYMSDEGMHVAYNILYGVSKVELLNKDLLYLPTQFLKDFSVFEEELLEAIKYVKKHNEAYSYAGDDDWIYAIHSMKLPMEIKRFCYTLNSYNRLGEVLNLLNNSYACNVAKELYWRLDGIWDYINARALQKYGDDV